MRYIFIHMLCVELWVWCVFCSQPLVPRENITAWMNAIGLVITALPVRTLSLFV